ncbi:MAG TPA: tetratricopeptide repeat protein, partial [Dongiaceae bacterium]|nr:tetratricopeptide repeat protein [Dongiaceae bacterium]
MSRPRAQAGAAKLVAILAATALLHLGVVATIRPESLPRHAAPSSSPEPAAEPAEVLRRASIEIAAAEAAHGPESREVATLLGATAQSLWWLEAYPAALPLSERALAISERTDPGSAVLAGLLYQVGELCRALGDYAGALRRLDEARALWSRTLGPRSPEVAAALHYLGVVHATTGDRDGARRLFEEALAIRLEKGGEDQEPVAATLVALAGLAADAGDPVAADRLQARALGIWERLHGPDHPMVARGLSGWAARRVAAGDLAGARALLERALAIRIGALGPDHDLVARTEIDLAEVRAREGEGLEAERLYHAALDRSRRRLDPDHPQVTEALLGRARLRWARGDRDGATAAAIDAETLARRRFLRTARGLSDGEALQYETMRATGLGLALTALADRSVCEGGAAILRRLDAGVIAARAIVLDNLTRRSAVAAPAVEGAIPAGEGPDEAAAVSFFDQVRRALPTGATLLAYVRYRQVDARGLDAGAAYLAFVLRSGAVAPEVVPLGDAEPIDAAVAAWREEVSVDPRLADG